MTTALPVEHRLYRRADRGYIGGVASGIADHIGISARVVRIAFIGLALAGGLGMALYGAYWIVLPTAPDAGPARLPRWLEYALGIAAAAIAIGATIYTSKDSFFVPTTLACLGGALIWRQATDSDRGRWRASFADNNDRVGRIRLFAGGGLVIAGAVLVLARENVTAVRDGILAVVVTVIGIALVSGPWWMRLVTQLSAERAERIRTQERADIAAHLHDSVLQTLALIQRNAGSPREVARLARGQERELRTLLYGSRTASGQFAEALRVAAGEVEDAYAITVEVVFVGDTVLDDNLLPVVAAAREAMVNAAKHSRVSSVSLYAEVEPDAVVVYVKDRGVGFDPEAVAEDRQGVRGSIVGRIERHGGEVSVRSAVGSGTEIEIRMPR